MNQAQRRFGEPIEIVRKKVFPYMNGMVRDFIAEAPFVVLATAKLLRYSRNRFAR